MIQDVKRSKPSLREVLPKTTERATGDAVRRPATSGDYELTVGERFPKKRWWLVTLAVILVVLGSGAWATWRWGEARIVLYPRAVLVEATVRLTASLTPTGSDLGYQLVRLDGQNERVLPATKMEAEPTPASGLITIYNNYSARPQVLIARTRFATSDGKIYRISKPVTVPGSREVDGKIEPGAVEATVISDGVGPDYNVGPTKFTIPGFKGDPRFEGFYAESVSPMTGGADGARLLPKPDELKTARESMIADLKNRLLTEARSSLPAEMIIFPLTALETTEKIVPLGENQVTVTQTADWAAAVFRRADLTTRLIQSLASYGLPPKPTIANLDGLDLLVLDRVATEIKEGRLDFNLSGKLLAVSEIDTNDWQARLAGAARGELAALASNDQTLERYDLAFRPPWLWHFPSTREKIIIEVATPVPDALDV